ncbi:MAG: hypothetical protein FD164_526 [Nitrospirae bacterium]|nr:MAG: hypothetical protein FD164_526 [Nitrospirota bacterium]
MLVRNDHQEVFGFRHVRSSEADVIRLLDLQFRILQFLQITNVPCAGLLNEPGTNQNHR